MSGDTFGSASAILYLAGFVLAAMAFVAGIVVVFRFGADANDQAEEQPARRLAKAELVVPRVEVLATSRKLGVDAGLAHRLAQAGFHSPSAITYFIAAKFVAAAVFALIGLGLLVYVPALAERSGAARLGFVTLLALVGYMLPARIVSHRRQEYFRRIELAIPDALDFMLVCVEAGQSIDFAVLRVSRELRSVHPELAAGFTALTEALSAGADRHEAFMRLAHETENDDLRQFASITVQSTTMGTPIADTFRVFAADLRDRRVRAVEERANVLPTKMTLGSMLFTVPPLMILLLAPAIYRLSTAF